MSKPDWKDAPEWAGYLAQNKDGEWYWYEYKPEKSTVDWSLSRCVGRSLRASMDPWELTCEERP